jgi:hypothetical protein
MADDCGEINNLLIGQVYLLAVVSYQSPAVSFPLSSPLVISFISKKLNGSATFQSPLFRQFNSRCDACAGDFIIERQNPHPAAVEAMMRSRVIYIYIYRIRRIWRIWRRPISPGRRDAKYCASTSAH